MPAERPQVQKKKTPFSNKAKFSLIIATFIFVISLGYFFYEQYTYVSTDDATIQAHVTLLSPKVSGIVNRVLIDEHQRVKAGQILVELETKDYRTALMRAISNLKSLQANYDQAKIDYHRDLRLFKAGSISKQVLDHATYSYYDLENRLEAARANIEEAQLNLEYTRLRAPTNGYIARKSVEIGMFASSDKSLLGFVQEEDRWVIANYKETDLDSIERGKSVVITVDAIPRRQFEGYVESISPSTGATFTLLPPDNATGNFTKVVQRVPVKIRFKNLESGDSDLLQAGLSANVSVRKHSEPQEVPSFPNEIYRTQAAGQTGLAPEKDLKR
jgi:membrane fusion protein (multidrug efflux system)